MTTDQLLKDIREFSNLFYECYEGTHNPDDTFSIMMGYFYSVFSARIAEGKETFFEDAFHLVQQVLPLRQEKGEEGQEGCYLPCERYKYMDRLEKIMPAWGYEHAYDTGSELVYLENPGVPFKDFVKNHLVNFDMVSHFFGTKSRVVQYVTEPATLELYHKLLPYLIAHTWSKDREAGFCFVGNPPLMQDQYFTYALHETKGIVGVYNLQKFLDGNIWGGNIYLDTTPELRPYSLALGLHVAVIRDFPECPVFEFGMNLDPNQNNYKRKLKGLKSSISYMWKEKA